MTARPIAEIAYQARVQINLIRDETAKAVHSGSENPYHRSVDAELQNKLYTNTIGFIMRAAANKGASKRFNGSKAAFQTPMLSAVNGIAAQSADEVDALIQPMCIVAQGNGDNPEIMANGIIGGSGTTLYNGLKSFATGTYLRARCPTHAEAIELEKLHATTIDTEGIVPLMLEPVDMNKVDYFTPIRMLKALEMLRNPVVAATALKNARKPYYAVYCAIRGVARFRAIMMRVVAARGAAAAMDVDAPNINQTPEQREEALAKEVASLAALLYHAVYYRIYNRAEKNGEGPATDAELANVSELLEAFNEMLSGLTGARAAWLSPIVMRSTTPGTAGCEFEYQALHYAV